MTRSKYPNGQDPMLRYQKPYWWPYKTYVKERWIGRELLEVVSTEFRERSVEYYKHALESGVTRVNGVIASPKFILRNGDRLDNTVHRHEPPITNDPILVLHKDEEKGFVMISKPGSIPVHATGRYFRHTVLEIMQSDHGIKCYSVNRLDRLTSGLMILALTTAASRDLSMEFVEGKIKKEYVARVWGKFPEERIVVDKELLTVDRQMGLVIVTPEGKEATTMFKRMHYDAERDQSVVHCRPLTGRTHQIRVHLQYLGHPIANDPLYGLPTIWGEELGKGGVDLVPTPLARPSEEVLASRVKSGMGGDPELAAKYATTNPDDRAYANIDAASPILLSQQAREIIAKLRRARDEAEDWIKWKEVVYIVKDAQEAAETASEPPLRPVPTASEFNGGSSTPQKRKGNQKHLKSTEIAELPFEEFVSPMPKPAYLPEGFCDQCFVPLPDDPDPEGLFIYLHALRYTTPKLGAWSTPLPKWAEVGWEGDWRGWSDQPVPEPFEDETGGEVKEGDVTKEGESR